MSKINIFISSRGSVKYRFWTPSKNDHFLINFLITIWRFWVKSGPTPFWHVFFWCSRINLLYYYNCFFIFSSKTQSKFNDILRKRQGFSLVLKITYFMKIHNSSKWLGFISISVFRGVTAFHAAEHFCYTYKLILIFSMPWFQNYYKT